MQVYFPESLSKQLNLSYLKMRHIISWAVLGDSSLSEEIPFRSFECGKATWSTKFFYDTELC